MTDVRTSTQEKLRAKGIENLLDLNPAHLRPLVPTPEEELAQNDLSCVHIDEIPRGWTQAQVDARNASLPLLPTRQQFEEGLIRSIELRLLAEDHEFDYQTEISSLVGHKTAILSGLAQKLQQNRLKQAKPGQKFPKTAQYGANHRVFAQNAHILITEIWGNAKYRVLAVLSVLTFTTYLGVLMQ